MSKFTCFVLFVVTVSLSNVNAAISEEDKAAVRAAFQPIISECSQEHGVSDDDIKSAKAAGSAEGVKPCFLSCVLTKAGVFKDGKYDENAGKEQLKNFVKNDEDFEKFVNIGKQCVSVNDKPGDECERASLFLACIVEHKAEIPL